LNQEIQNDLSFIIDIMIEGFLDMNIPKSEYLKHVEDLTEKAHTLVDGNPEIMEWFVYELEKRLQEL
jgi:hypothetical protein